MIALLFALLAIAMVLAWDDRWRWSFVVFAIVLVMSIYWLDFHATTPLKIKL
ncbi:DUF5993 family protein [Hoeflea prorocentri]|uniref:DUF5993 family protein n=1 Tax=Hoeflea prorocentri TaxID=1922333 RepID=A0A9X3UGW8_9HYPH|nr:DUF5993 family protein [Hoeflea prorocentri]MCY6380441.1 DUF5993 family protein [Hoeflea prorocentri]MDA5398241.1 DUF5993 family protein [Hoeflea prorocentri]